MDNEAPRYTEDGTRIIPGPDGLEELDYPIPRWMGVIYLATILFGIGYMMCMPGVGMNGLNWSQYKQYRQEMAEAPKPPAPVSEANVAQLLNAVAKNPHEVMEGGKAFATNCAACHGENGKGAIGPDLTDSKWLYGGKLDEIAHTIANGTAKGMPPFKTSMSDTQRAELAAYVYSLSKH